MPQRQQQPCPAAEGRVLAAAGLGAAAAGLVQPQRAPARLNRHLATQQLGQTGLRPAWRRC